MKKLSFLLIFSLLLGCVTLGLLELALRVIKLGYTHPRAFFIDFHLTLHEDYWKDKFDHIPDIAYVRIDPQLGWTLNPNKASKDSMFISNSMGLRANREYLTKSAGTLRIGIFGDSFTHGNEVGKTETWGHVLEQELQGLGIPCEVLNFGVPGYGMGQAYLRYLKDGTKRDLDVVVFGFQMENIWRNLNVFRPCYLPKSGIPFSKPRAFIQEDALHFLNLPTIPKDSLLNYISEPDQRPLLWEKEYFHDTELLLETNLFTGLYAVAAFRELFHPKKEAEIESIFDCKEALPLMRKIVQSFQEEVAANDAQFVLLQLPMPPAIRHFKKKGKHPHSIWLYPFFDQYNTYRTDSILAQHDIGEVFDGHFTAMGNELIGRNFANWLSTQPQLLKPNGTGPHSVPAPHQP